MPTLHDIRAHLYDNVLTEDLNDFIARVQSERSLNVMNICQSAVTRGGADISAAAMEHATNLWFKEMAYRLCDGFSVNTGWFTANAHIKGVFNSPRETFNPAKHTLLFSFQQGSLLRKEIASTQVTILGVAETSLSIAQVTDVKSGSVNDLLTANRNLRISGSKLKIAGDSEANGVYFIHQPSQERIRVEDSDIVNNHPSELIIVIPDLGEGEYLLEITTQHGGRNQQLLKNPRTVVFDRTLTVV